MYKLYLMSRVDEGLAEPARLMKYGHFYTDYTLKGFRLYFFGAQHWLENISFALIQVSHSARYRTAHPARYPPRDGTVFRNALRRHEYPQGTVSRRGAARCGHAIADRNHPQHVCSPSRRPWAESPAAS